MPSLAIITGALGNLGTELLRQCTKHYDRVIAIDRKEFRSGQDSLTSSGKVDWYFGSDGNLKEYGNFTSLVENSLNPSQGMDRLVVFHAAADVRFSSTLPATDVFQNNVSLTLTVLEEAIVLSRKYSFASLKFVTFDSIGRVLVTSNSMNYSASKAAQNIYVRQLQTRDYSDVSILNLYLGFDDSSTNDHIRVNWLKMSTESMVRNILSAAMGRRRQASIPRFRNAVVTCLSITISKFPPKFRRASETVLQSIFRSSP